MCLRLSQEPTLYPGIWSRRRRKKKRERWLSHLIFIHGRRALLEKTKLGQGKGSPCGQRWRESKEVTMSAWCFFRRFKAVRRHTECVTACIHQQQQEEEGEDWVCILISGQAEETKHHPLLDYTEIARGAREGAAAAVNSESC